MLLPSVGGIHSVNDNEIHESSGDYVLLDADIAFNGAIKISKLTGTSLGPYLPTFTEMKKGTS